MNLTIETMEITELKKKYARRRLDSSRLPIRPKNKKTRLWIDNEFFSGGYAATLPRLVLSVYCVLAKYANAKKQTCYPSIPLIMKEVGTKNKNSVIRAIKILEAYCIIVVDHSKGRASNEYGLLTSEVWKPVNSIEISAVGISKKANSNTFYDKQYQNNRDNSIKDDTRIHIREFK